MSRTADRPCYVLDASVAVKWFLSDESDTSQADALLADFREDRVSLVAPEHVLYEVPSAIRNSLRTGRVTVEQARLAIEKFIGWHIPTVHDDALLLSAYEVAVRFGCSYYDGLYLALAEATGFPLISADGRLRRALGDRFPLARWLVIEPT